MVLRRVWFLGLTVFTLAGCKGEHAGGVRKVASLAELDAVLKDNPVVLVDFYAEWCGPCQTMKPIVRELARKYSGKVAVVEVDTDEAQDVAQRHGVQFLPTFVVFRDGRVLNRASGAMSRGALEGSLRKALGE